MIVELERMFSQQMHICSHVQYFWILNIGLVGKALFLAVI